jgi:serine/threonine protein kinase
MDNSASPKQLAGRYEIRQVLGQGGMGLVYRAYDTVVRREVAVKTILDIPDPASLQLFYKECDVLASMSHPNIVEIFDIGEFEEEGKFLESVGYRGNVSIEIRLENFGNQPLPFFPVEYAQEIDQYRSSDPEIVASDILAS